MPTDDIKTKALKSHKVLDASTKPPTTPGNCLARNPKWIHVS